MHGTFETVLIYVTHPTDNIHLWKTISNIGIQEACIHPVPNYI